MPSAALPPRGDGETGELDAIVLAGGGGRRAGGVDKPGLLVGGRTLAAAVVAAVVGAGARRVVVVGPERPEARDAGLAAAAEGPGVAAAVVFVREDPPGAGPVPALACGLAEVSAPMVAVLAADLPFLAAQPLRAVRAALGGHAGAIMVDDGGREQWLLGCWRTDKLREALRGYRGQSLRGLLGPLAPAPVRWDGRPGEPPPWLDCDTPEDFARARELTRPRTGGAGKEGTIVSTVDRWVEAACGELGLNPADVDTRALLDLARDVAHGVDRPAAPLTAFLLGVAVGRGEPMPDAAARLRELAAGWEQPAGQQG